MRDEPQAGMYEIGNKDVPQITVGGFVIVRQDENSVWIQDEGGDGAQFSNELFEAAIRAFFNEHF